MSMIIQLDVQSMEKLFPEGSEARVELRRVAIIEFSKRLKLDITKFPAEVKAAIDKATIDRQKAVQAAVDKCVKDYEAQVRTEGMIGHIRPSSWKGATPTFELTSEMKRAIEAAVKTAFNDTIQSTIGSMLPTLLQDYLSKDKVSEFVDQHVLKQLETAAGQRVKALFAGM